MNEIVHRGEVSENLTLSRNCKCLTHKPEYRPFAYYLGHDEWCR